jgi:2-polyprenyl-3-methyl-5-hydroxy-6-metoxy-1,4-benzoquinol methylase
MVVSRTWPAHHMFKKVSHSQEQSQFYDEHPPLSPWPELLRQRGLSCLYKPREVFWKKALDGLKIKAGEKVLDVGCGQGLFLARLTRTYKTKGVGIDVSKKSVGFARKNYARKNLSYRVADATQIPFRDSSFDILV